MTPDLHFCLGADCAAYESVPSLHNPHPAECSVSGSPIACCFEDKRESTTIALEVRRAAEAFGYDDEDRAYHHLRLAFTEMHRQERIAGYTRELEAHMPPEER